MFEHLDDPRPYTPPAGLRTAVEGRARHRRRRRVALAGGVASVAALGVGTTVAVRARLEPQRIEVGGLAEQPDDGRVGVLEAERVDPGGPVTVLVVGVDQSDALSQPDAPSQDETGRLADSIGLVRIDPAAGEVRLLTVPRDLSVDGERIDHVFEAGGPDDLVRTIDAELGVPVDHYVEVDFAGARELVDAIGGIRVAVDSPVRDDQSGLDLDAGCQELDGDATLALGRSRHAEVQRDDGGWTPDPWSAISRESRGAVVAAALLQAAGRIGVGDLPALVETGFGSITVDADLDTDDVERWARDSRDDRFVTLGLPVTTPADLPSHLLLADGAAEVVDAFLDGGTDPVPAAVDGTPVAEATGLRPC